MKLNELNIIRLFGVSVWWYSWSDYVSYFSQRLRNERRSICDALGWVQRISIRSAFSSYDM